MLAGAAPAEGDGAGITSGAQGAGAQLEVRFIALLFGAAILFVGIVPQPLFELVENAARGLG